MNNPIILASITPDYALPCKVAQLLMGGPVGMLIPSRSACEKMSLLVRRLLVRNRSGLGYAFSLARPRRSGNPERSEGKSAALRTRLPSRSGWTVVTVSGFAQVNRSYLIKIHVENKK